jgi:hypothetical protein
MDDRPGSYQQNGGVDACSEDRMVGRATEPAQVAGIAVGHMTTAGQPTDEFYTSDDQGMEGGEAARPGGLSRSERAER